MKRIQRTTGWWLALVVLLLLASGSLFVAPAARAQGFTWPQTQITDWRERQTNHFILLYALGDEAQADYYAGFVDDIYEELAAIFSHRTAAPITLRLYPTLESYYQVNPLARNVPGVVAHADFRRRELVVVVEQTRNQPPEELPNNIRHELAHIIASDLSGNRLNTGFHEGIAQYVEQTSPALLEQKILLLERARDQGRLMAWSDFEDRDKIYGDPPTAYPQALSVVAFLVDRYGFGKFRDFLIISGRSSGYRSALERAYGVSPRDLEEQWRDWLPSYLAGGYRRNALTSYDLSYPTQLLEQGRYAEAATDLEQAIEWLERQVTTQQQETVATARQLLARSREGQRAERLAEGARTALEQAEYQRAGQLVAQARAAYVALGDTRQDAVLAAYEERVVRGLSADAQLAQAGQLARAFRFPQARVSVDAAAAEFAALGDQIRLESALALRSAMDQRQRLAGLALLGLGSVGMLVGLWSVFTRRNSELW